MTRHTVDVADGVQVHVESDGDGPALVLVNGAFCTTRQWDHVLPALTESFRVVRHDVRGTGQSGPGPVDDYRFEQYADDIVTICEALDIELAALWGMAWGARVGLVTAARHGGRFGRVVLSDLAIDPADVAAQGAGQKAAAEARSAAGIAEVDRPEGWASHRDADEAAQALSATRLHPDLFGFVTQVRNPVLVVTGDHDPNLVSSQRALPGFADGRLEVLAHTGHGSVLQRPQHTAEVVLRFLLG